MLLLGLIFLAETLGIVLVLPAVHSEHCAAGQDLQHHSVLNVALQELVRH